MDDLERLTKDWLAAEGARRQFVDDHVSTAWEGQPMVAPKRALTRESLTEYEELRKAEEQAYKAYRDAFPR